MEAIIPIEMVHPTLRTQLADSEDNRTLLLEELDLAEEKRERRARQQQRLLAIFDAEMQPFIEPAITVVVPMPATNPSRHDGIPRAAPSKIMLDPHATSGRTISA